MAIYAPLPAGLRRKSAFIFLALLFGFVLLTLCFKLAAPYDNYFFTASRTERFLYIFARVAFAAYLFGVLFGAGQWLLRVMARRSEPLPLTACEEIAASMLLGSALIRICMFALGFAKLYFFWLLMPLATLALAGAARLPQLLRLPQLPREAPRASRIARIVLLAALAAAVTIVMAFKFVYPNGTGDYFTHYFHYYVQVIKSAGIWPNDVWYHFYISKGVGDVFLAMILSDALAPLAVSFVMYLTGIAIGYAFLKRMTQNVLGSLAVSVMLASAFIWTHQTHKPFVGEWAEFSKQHVIMSVLLLGAVWATWLLQELPTAGRGLWRNVTAIIIIGLVILRPQSAALYEVYLIPLALIAAYRRSQLLRTYVCLAFVAAITVLVILTINYAITGLAEITPYRPFWKFADQERFSHWVSPFLMLQYALGSSSDFGGITTPDFGHYRRRLLLALIFRLDLVVPYAVALLPCAGVLAWFAWRKSLTLTPALLRGMGCLVAMLFAAVVTACCNNQIISTFRLYMFCLYPVLMITGVPFALMHRISFGKPWLEKAAAVAMVLVALIALVYPLHKSSNKPKHHAIQFVLGRSNIADAYREQHFLSSPGNTACQQVPPDTRIWSSQVTGDLLESPHCRFETFFSYAMERDFAVVNFEDADAAETALRKQKLDYFLIDTSAPFFDILPYSPLFSPPQIGRHLGVVWSQGGAYLLTWRSPRTTPLTPEFFADYQKSLQTAQVRADFRGMHQALAGYYFEWKRNPHWPVALDPNAPLPRGWQ